jgi:preprotein translocase subunit SecD
MLMLRATLAALLLLTTACTTTVAGSGGPDPEAAPKAQSLADPQALRFRHVMRTAQPGRAPGAPQGPVPSPADLEALRSLRQPSDPNDPTAVQAALDTLDCTAPDPIAGMDDRHGSLVACETATGAAYVLGPAFLTGDDIASASARKSDYDESYVVLLEFTSDGAELWGRYTEENVGKQVAILLDTDVLSAPTIQEAITNGETQISGTYTKEDAEALVARLTGG